MKCRYCRRALRIIPHTPAEIEPHCTSRGCPWCYECAQGQTPVSPGFDPARYGRTRGPKDAA